MPPILEIDLGTRPLKLLKEALIKVEIVMGMFKGETKVIQMVLM